MTLNLFDLKKLIAHGYLNESSLMAPTSTITKQQLIQRITKTISQCFEGPHIEDSVQLQIVKVKTRMKLFFVYLWFNFWSNQKCLLTILTSPHIEIHEQTMLLAIKTCYNIQITSSSLVNQASSRAALTQIINTILYRLELAVSNLLF